MRIAVLGASVSAQAKHHQTGVITGYSEVLRQDYQQELNAGPDDIRRMTFPGNRLSDGGLMRLRDVLNFKPDICLFEPLIQDRTRGRNATADEIAYVYASLVEAGILPVTVLLPEPKDRKPERHHAFARYNDFCTAQGLPVIRIDLSDVGDLEGRFKGIHTLPEGARIYASRIVDGLKQLGDPKALLARLTGLPRCADLPVAITQVPVGGNGPHGAFHFQMRPEHPGVRRARLVQFHRIGPFSPVLDITTRQLIAGSGAPDPAAEPVQSQISVWDPYCHYEWDSFAILAEIDLNGHNPVQVQVALSATDPDYGTCRREVAKWPGVSERRLHPVRRPFLISDGPVSTQPIIAGHP